MALTNTGSNRFGPSSYIVGPVLGDGCNFTSIQDAITQAVADGFDDANPTTILVRPGIYASFTMAPGIQVEGVCAGSAFSNSAAVVGNITIDSTTVGGTTYAIKNLNVSDPADAVIVQGVGPAIFVDIANCSINGTRGIVIGNTSGTLSQFAIRECRVVASSIAIDLQLHNTVFSEQSTFSGGTVFAMSGDSRAALFDCVLDATVDYGFQMTGSVNRLNLNYTNIDSPQESIIGTNSGEVVNVTHCTFTSSATSGFYIDAVDIYEFYDLAIKGTAVNVNAIAINFIDWTPHAATAANATLPGGVRGTACFDSAIFTVTDGWVTHIAGPPASTFPVDNGGPGVPLAGAMSILGSTSVDFPNPSGIETHVGATTNEIYLEDRRWVSSLIVDPSATVGLRGTFQTISAALAAATSGQVIYVRPGTYTESLALVDNVDIVGLTSWGQSTDITVQGTVTAPAAGSCSLRNLYLEDGGNAYTVEANGAGGTVSFVDCQINSINTAAFHLVSSDVTLNRCLVSATVDAFVDDTGSPVARIFYSRIDAASYVFNNTTTASYFVDTCILVSAAAGILFSTGFPNCEIINSQLIANASPAIDLQNGGQAELRHNTIRSPNQAISFNAAGPLVRSYHNNYFIAAGSEYVVGPGTFEYGSDVVNPLSAAGIDLATVQVKFGWRPWAEAGAGPAPAATVVRGTSAYDSSQFALTDGFVQLLSTAVATQYVTDTGTVMPVANSINVFGGPGVTVTGAGDTITVNSVVWSDTGVNQLVDVDEGSFATAGITLTLPAAPTIGEECRFVVATGGSLTIQANAGQTIHIGNMASSVAGTASSTDTGDFVTLTAQSATEWWATGVIGNWTLA